MIWFALISTSSVRYSLTVSHSYTVYTYSIGDRSYGVAVMSEGHFERSADQKNAITLWYALLRDEVALLKKPGAHHKALLAQAHALYRDRVIGQDDLSDLLEQADGALAYAVEALIDCTIGEQG